MLGKMTFGPFVEEPDDDAEADIAASSSLFSKEPRYWSSAKIPFSMDGSMLNRVKKNIKMSYSDRKKCEL